MADENDCSLVLEFQYVGEGERFSALFTGDISENTEKGITASLPDCDYLKVAHHGSRHSTSDEFLGMTRPEISVISAGAGNSYGHPHRETLNRLSVGGGRIYCTADLGEIILRVHEGKALVTTMVRRRY